jgi:hypothetical protein
MLSSPYNYLLKRGILASWFPVSVFIVHVVLSRGFNAYEELASTDIPMHVLGGVAITYFYAATFRGVEAHLFRESNKGYLIYLLFLFALTGGDNCVVGIRGVLIRRFLHHRRTKRHARYYAGHGTGFRRRGLVSDVLLVSETSQSRETQ